jgi:hypothetical protein
MRSKGSLLNSRQLAFKELFVGTLIYAVVLGFFNDYTDIVEAKSFSTIFFAAIVLQILTYLVFVLKDRTISRFRGKEGLRNNILLGFNVWLILFLSKFIFIWVVDIIFGDYININGFFGILFVVLAVTITHKAADKVFKALGEN